MPTAGISTPCIVVLQVELQYLLSYYIYIHFGGGGGGGGEHMTLAVSQITMAIVIGT